MQITRHNHTRYMAKVTPVLIFLYLLQIATYRFLLPTASTGDVAFFLGMGLIVIIGGFLLYNTHHRVILHPNYIEVKFDFLKMKEEIIYQNITHVEMKTKKHHYANLVLHLRDGSTSFLYHVDSPELICEFIEKKKSGSFR